MEQVLNLSKDQKIDLTKGTQLKTVRVGLGWETASDLDAFAICVGNDGKLTNNAHTLSYGSPEDCPEFAPKGKQIFGGALKYTGDVRNGNEVAGAKADDESIIINLDQVPSDIDRIWIGANIYGAPGNGEKFGGVKDAGMRLYNQETGEQIASYDLNEDLSNETGCVFGCLYRRDGEWKLETATKGVTGDLGTIFNSYR
jgi:tellurium resistance protein TerD